MNHDSTHAARNRVVGRVDAAAFIAAACLLAGTSVYFLKYGRVNHDEGWALYAAQMLARGELPYRDFPFYQAPMLAIAHALPQGLWPGVETGRWTCLVASALMCGLGLRLAFERGGAVAIAIFALGIAGAPLAIGGLVATRTESLSTLFLMLAAFSLTRPQPRVRNGAVAIVAGVLAATSRISLVPAALFVFVWALHRTGRESGNLGRTILPGALVGVAIGALTFAGGFERAWTNLVTIQLERHEQFDAPVAFDSTAWWMSRAAHGVELAGEFGVISMLALLATLASGVVAWRRRHRTPCDERTHHTGPLVVLALLAWLPNLAPRSVYPVYFVPAMPLVLVLGGGWLEGMRLRWLASGGSARVLNWAMVVALVALATLQYPTFASRNARSFVPGPTDLEQFEAAAQLVERHIAEPTLLLTFDTYVAVEAHRRVAPGFEMSVFSWFPKRPAQDFERLGLLTTPALRAAFENPAVGGVVLSDQALGILIHGGHFGYQPRRRLEEAEILRALPLLQRFRLVDTLHPFGQQRSMLYIFVPRRELEVEGQRPPLTGMLREIEPGSDHLPAQQRDRRST
ncbi:MAG: hypothetical protein GY944_06750 [bacterium]|nr:hypothetical protein [bacterium]